MAERLSVKGFINTTKVLEAIETLQAAGLLKWEPNGRDIVEATLGKVALVTHNNGDIHLNFGDSNFVGEKSPLGDIVVPTTSPLVKVAKDVWVPTGAVLGDGSLKAINARTGEEGVIRFDAARW